MTVADGDGLVLKVLGIGSSKTYQGQNRTSGKEIPVALDQSKMPAQSKVVGGGCCKGGKERWEETESSGGC